MWPFTTIKTLLAELAGMREDLHAVRSTAFGLDGRVTKLEMPAAVKTYFETPVMMSLSNGKKPPIQARPKRKKPTGPKA